ncbi:uncharacterized protein TRAVEDRAFT_46954 [Trametes versicolor FP-101664 SS1]|uniref:uncharacterized protein n=1 Tax=Trametes versicolor (strain FP-101664) TaxID=717944 RepID=UPI0004621A10|nr:uncharacterized protein TRAVEDRAFT_46954 [Trametes versicolor FP-101664 SS1]EIW59651.1 hypothetical protein TRAVEDRAFT_46954 [Trametes versicolor FP-101664 SS1]
MAWKPRYSMLKNMLRSSVVTSSARRHGIARTHATRYLLRAPWDERQGGLPSDVPEAGRDAMRKMFGAGSEAPPTLISALRNGRTEVRRALQLSQTDAIDQLDSYVRDIQVLTRTELNSRRATLRALPAEVLGIIFEYALSAEEVVNAPNDTVWQGCVPMSTALLKLLQICKHWRDILQSFAFPWTVIDDHESELFIQNSKQLPVSVHVEHHHSQLVPRLPGLGPRLRELFWGRLYSEARKTDVLTFPAPQLELLYLNCYNEHTAPINQPSPMLFSGHAPRLRRLHLAGHTCLPGNQFTVLTHLCLQNICPALKITAIVGLLQRCPRLEHLAFMGHMPIHPDDPAPHPLPPADTPQMLPHLRRLSFDSVSSRFIANITHIIYPRRPDFAIQVLELPINRLNTVMFCLCAVPFLAPNPLTYLAYVRQSWHSSIGLIGFSARGALRIFSAHEHIDSDNFNPDRDTSWALAQLDRLVPAAVEEFSFDFLRIRQAQPPVPVGTREVFARVRAMSCLRALNVATNDLSMFLVMLYGGFFAPLLVGGVRWHLEVLRIFVGDNVPGQGLVVWNPFNIVDLGAAQALAIDSVVIHCDLDPGLFTVTLDTLRAMVPSVAFGRTADLGDAARTQVPEGFASGMDPVAHSAWEGSRWYKPIDFN